jgi:hypothetical protein
MVGASSRGIAGGKTIAVGALLGAVILAASSARRSASSSALAEDSRATARYLANAGVLVTSGETKIVFDPLSISPPGHRR